jgi:hemerythrin-like domain-containing protein
MSKRTNALELLRKDHRDMQALFPRFDRSSGKEQDRVCRQMVDALKMHTRIEEEVFYPYVREATDREDLVEEANIEHGTAKQLIADLESHEGDGVHRQAVVHVLGQYLGLHIREEEDRIFPLVEKAGVDLEALGEELLEHRKRQQDEPPSEPPEELMKRAKWIESPDEREDYPGQTLATRNPEVIKAWAEARKARPATVPGYDPQHPRVLRLDFPGYREGLVPVSWEAWLRVFEERKLVFLFQQHLSSGRRSNFFHLYNPERDEEVPSPS